MFEELRAKCDEHVYYHIPWAERRFVVQTYLPETEYREAHLICVEVTVPIDVDSVDLVDEKTRNEAYAKMSKHLQDYQIPLTEIYKQSEYFNQLTGAENRAERE